MNLMSYWRYQTASQPKSFKPVSGMADSHTSREKPMKNITLFSYSVLLTCAHIVAQAGSTKKRKSVNQMLDMLSSIYEQIGAIAPNSDAAPVVPPSSDRRN